MDLKLRQLRYFKAVVDHKTIAAASEQLHIAQPPISKHIRQLEDEWGVALFERVNHRLHLRDEGRHLYARAQELLQLASDLDVEMRRLGSGEGGCVRVGTVASGVDLVARGIADLHTGYPAVEFSCWQGEPLFLEENVINRRLDLAVVHSPVETPGLDAITLAPLRFVALARQDMDFGDQISLETLSRHPLLLLRRNSPAGSFEKALARFAECGLRPRVVAECSDMPILEALVHAGMGVALVQVHPHGVTRATAAGLVQVPVTGFGNEGGQLVLIRKHEAYLSNAVDRLLARITAADAGPARDCD